MTMPNYIDIRIKRLRTPAKDSTPELLERWASREGISNAGAVLHLLSTHPQFRVFMADARNPGKETR